MDYNQVIGFLHRDPQEDLNNAYYWRSLETAEERRAFFEFTGNRFTALHHLPGWYTSLCSPPDAMHLFYLGGMNQLLIQTLFQPGMLTKHRPTDKNPVVRFNRCLDQMWMPKNFSRLPPKVIPKLHSLCIPNLVGLAWTDQH
jgi:hypothetical protein